MRKTGILNSQLAELMAKLGHTDTFAIADCGLPVPAGVPVVDLALVFGIPRFAEVWDAMMDELEIEAITIADSTPDKIRALIPQEVEHVEEVSHDELKKMVASASFVVRTGETTPFANAVLRSGVPF